MSLFRIILLVLAFCAACMAAALVYLWVPRQGATPATVTTAPTKAVIVTARALPRGHKIGPNDLTWRDWPASALPKGAITIGKNETPPASLIGRRPRHPLDAGEPVTEARLLDAGKGGLMASNINAGKRAVSAVMSYASGAGGFILPEDRVDVLVTIEMSGPRGRLVASTRTVLRDIRVLAVNQSVDAGDKSTIEGETVTLEVSPQEAEALAHAETEGKLTFSLRGFDEPDLAKRAMRGPKSMITIYRGGEVSERVSWSGARQ